MKSCIQANINGYARYHHQTAQDPKTLRLTDSVLVQDKNGQSSGSASCLADTQKYDTLDWYRKWASTEGFAVIDVNFPNFLVGVDVCCPALLKESVVQIQEF